VNAIQKSSAAKIKETTVQTTQIALAIAHSAAVNMIHGRATQNIAETVTHKKNAARVKLGLLTKSSANANLVKLVAQMILILRIICAVIATTTVAQEICGPRTNIANAIQRSTAAQVKQTARIVFAKKLTAVLVTTGQTTSIVLADHSKNAAMAMFGQLTKTVHASLLLIAVQAKLGITIKTASVIQPSLAAQAMFGQLIKTAVVTPKLIVAHKILILATNFVHATQLISAAQVMFGAITKNAHANKMLTVARAIFGLSTKTANVNQNIHAVQDKHGKKILKNVLVNTH
jgi:hypothetical protein